MKLRFIVLILPLLLFLSCKGPKGDTGATGETGQKGDTGDPGITTKGDPADFDVFNGIVGGDGVVSAVSIGDGVLSPNASVTVMIALPEHPNTWIELTQPDTSVTNGWAAVYYDISAVGLFNCEADWFYKIIVMKPALSPQLSAKERFNYFNF